jgi:hypothetical protein
MNAASAYPLGWPDGWPRTPPDQRKTSNPFTGMTFDRARRLIVRELKSLNATDPVLSMNVPLRGDGEPRADAARYRVDDPGVAIYFTLKGKQMTMAQDRYWDIHANLRSLGLAIEAMRQLERHGGGTMMERAFAGFAALPPPGGAVFKRPWWQVLGYSNDAEDRRLLSVEEVTARYRTLVKQRHPDNGGSAEAFTELTEARDEAVRALG